MKKKSKTSFVCSSCGHDSAKWLGRCPSCNNWNTFNEERFTKTAAPARQLTGFSSPVLKLSEVETNSFVRVKTGINEFDNMLGGGIAKGSLLLLGGAPGIGKSTLMLQVSGALGALGKVLYVSGEESLSQVKSRAERLNVNTQNIYLASETNLQNIIDAVENSAPEYLVVDSIQTMYHPEITSAPGTVAQVRECAAELLRVSKSKNITVFLLGHVTKDGDIAGPRVLEHIVDTVLYFENERSHTYRFLRSHKNRFGPTSEVGIFEMLESGLAEVSNASELFLSERALKSAGNIVTPSMEGTRPILLEVQALSARTAFGMPRRMVSGYDVNRVIIMIAVLEKRLGIALESQDVFVNIAGGVKVKETALDLAAACAIVSSNAGFVCAQDISVFGEVGLSGEIRAVSFAEARLNEAEKLGFKKVIMPKANLKGLNYKGKIEILAADTIDNAIKLLRGN
ncbi:MAG: DNA repair protein RadA [Elusimicrobia bacterium]|nr:DNA repair protein RadA [Elusimicrobiota bacterium]